MKRLILLAERKANFINKINDLSSRVFAKLAQKTNKEHKTSALSILRHLKNLLESGKNSWKVEIFLDDYKNFNIPSFPESGKPFPFVFEFDIKRAERDYNLFDYKGRCRFDVKNGKFNIAEILIKVDVYLPEDFNPQKYVFEFVDGMRGVLAHEIAHVNDDEKQNEIGIYTKKDEDFSNTKEIKYLKYYLNPSEIRSHVMEMVAVLKNNKHNNINKQFKERYKTSDKAEEYGIKHTEEQKNMTKRVYSMLKKKEDNITIDEISKEKLRKVINKDLSRNYPTLLRRFIFDYHISFLKNYNSKMKERYYDKFFSNTEAYDLDIMKKFFADIIYVGYQLFLLYRSVEDIFENYKENGGDKNVIKMVQDFNNFYSEFWNNTKFSDAFKNYDSFLLVEVGEKIIANFEEKWNI